MARDQLSVLLAQMRVGRVTLCRVEEARVAENDRWMAFTPLSTMPGVRAGP